ncbi:MAG: bifunctional riboflavin kinase/FAD synthetase [Paracoccaceae bacterium]|nr:bifunctional riboflavin kinase/FAD synthetase [Paracoccaceae bacterium]
MRVIRDYEFVEDIDKGSSVAIGNFDGVHLGHQSVIDLARKEAKAHQASLGILTFEPHPRSYFAPQAPAFRLMGPEARETRLEKLGIDLLYEMNFNASLSELTPEEFAQKIICDGLALKHVVIGADFCFGKGRLGNVTDLQRFGEEMGFGVTIAPLIAAGLSEVSSTSIRKALYEGRPRDAAAQLGHWHRIEGPVIGGEQRGRELGYPTANMSMDGLHLPKLGVYAVLVDILDGPYKGTHHGAASLGVRPMFGENAANLETFLFDFAGDLYGTNLSVALVDFLRPELSFDGLQALIDQMAVDCDQARRILSAP